MLRVTAILKRLVPLAHRGCFASIPRILLLSAVSLLSLQAGTVIAYDVTSLGIMNGLAAYRYTYTITGLDLLADQELDLQFDPQKYGSLFNGFAGAGFDLLLFQPNTPPGARGDYSALALISHPSLGGRFSVDFTWLATSPPGAQPFQIFDDSGALSIEIGSGATAPLVVSTTPEPGTFAAAALSSLILVAGMGLHRRRRS